MILTGFKPIVGESPKILILGSMPSEKSLQQTEYYAHPQNAFWAIMGELFNFDHKAGYAQRTNQLKQHHIALWDVIAQCTREGSLDTSIDKDSIVANDFSDFFSSHPTIDYVFFNGNKAEQEFNKRILPVLGDTAEKLTFQRLPSTSPANARMSKKEKLKHWSVLKKILNKGMNTPE